MAFKIVPARPKIRPGQEDVKSRRRLIKGDRRQLLCNYDKQSSYQGK